jgi:hypothetical protein
LGVILINFKMNKTLIALVGFIAIASAAQVSENNFVEASAQLSDSVSDELAEVARKCTDVNPGICNRCRGAPGRLAARNKAARNAYLRRVKAN